MIAVSVRDKHVVYRAEVNAHLLGISDKDITRSCIE